MLAELGTCNEYQGRTTFGLEKSLCDNFHGTFATAGCSTDNQIASCVMSDGEVKRYYGSKIAGDHALSIEEAKSDCESDVLNGKFTVDPNANLANSAAAGEPPSEEAKPAPKSMAGKAGAKAAAAKAGARETR
jgi:hypothetical protein